MTDFDSTSLPDLDAEQERLLEALLRNAYAPREIELTRHEQLLRVALEDPFASATNDELARSERLRHALEGRAEYDADVALLHALAAAYAPKHSTRSRSPEFTQGPFGSARARRTRRTGHLGALALITAAAAALVLVVASAARHGAVAPRPLTPDLPTLALARSRSSAALFKLGSAGNSSDRIDRIVSARSRDLRDNRYALWGVR